MADVNEVKTEQEKTGKGWAVVPIIVGAVIKIIKLITGKKSKSKKEKKPDEVL